MTEMHNIYPCVKDCAVYICQECGYSGFYATMHLHVKREHKMNAAQYLAKHGKYVFKAGIYILTPSFFPGGWGNVWLGWENKI